MLLLPQLLFLWCLVSLRMIAPEARGEDQSRIQARHLLVPSVAQGGNKKRRLHSVHNFDQEQHIPDPQAGLARRLEGRIDVTTLMQIRDHYSSLMNQLLS